MSELKQQRLLNGKLIEADHGGPLHPPKGCTEACYSAESEKEECTCQCRGTYHGLGRANQLAQMQEKHKAA